MDIKNLVLIRPVLEEDVAFIFNSWLKSFRGSLFAKTVPSVMFFSNHHKIIEQLLKTHTTLIACNKDDPTQIYGYINFEASTPFITHFVYVKEHFRKLGIAKELFKSAGIDFSVASVYSHHTMIAEKLSQKYNMFHSPYLMLNKLVDFNMEEKENKEPKTKKWFSFGK